MEDDQAGQQEEQALEEAKVFLILRSVLLK